MGAPKVLIADSISQRGRDELAAGGALEVCVQTSQSEADLVKLIPAFSAPVLRSQTKVTGPILQVGHRPQAVGSADAGRRNAPGGEAIEAIATVLSVRDDIVPPTINLEDPDDDVRVDVPREARKMVIPAALNDSFGFGGHNAALLFRKA